MREHVIQTWCDQHAAASEDSARVAASHQLLMATDLDPALRLDLCQDCWDQLVTPLAKTLADYGAKPEAPAAHAARRQAAPPSKQQHNDPGVCPLCSQHYTWLSTHITSVHGLDATDSVCPACQFKATNPTHLGRHFLDEHGQRLKWYLAEQAAKTTKRPRSPRTVSKASKAPG